MKDLKVLIYCLSITFIISLNGCTPALPKPDKTIDTIPSIFPDYTDITFPANIAPPNFLIQENATTYFIEIGTTQTVFYRKKNKGSSVIIPEKVWKRILRETAGGNFYMRIYGLDKGEWIQYKDIKNTISTASIDSYLVYRLLYPGYELWNEMGIYQRDLSSYKVTPILENKTVAKGCVNCHTFSKNSSSTMMLHIRGKMGGTLIQQNGNTRKVDIKSPDGKNPATYSSWHPSGRYIALSTNNVNQFFHSTGFKAVEVSDSESDLILFDTQTNEVITDPSIYGPEWMETFPTWNPSGDMLYFCRAKAISNQTPLDSIRYDLYRIPFNIENSSFGDPECVYSSSEESKSVSLPRISPDGRYLMFVRFDYGTFSIWHPESELYLLDIETGTIREMEEVNSDNVESFHTWSSTGEWFVFSSKRIDGLWAHPYISFFDSTTGIASKPFILPQKDPSFYKKFTKTFNLPELITSPIDNKKFR